MATRTPGVVPTITRIATAVKTILAAPVQTLATSLPTNKTPKNKERAVELNIRGTSTVPSGDTVKTLFATSLPTNKTPTNKERAVELNIRGTRSGDPYVVVRNTPATALQPALTVVAAPPNLRTKPAVVKYEELPKVADPTPLPKTAFDYKTAGLIALAAVVVLGGMVMWSGQSKGKTQAVARNAKRMFHKQSNAGQARLKKETRALEDRMSTLSESRLMQLAQYGRNTPEGRAAMIELENRAYLAQR